MSNSSTNSIRTDYAKSVRPEPVEGLGGVIAESVETQTSPSTGSGRTVQREDDFISFTLALEKYKKFLLTISCDLSNAANRIPLLLATYILENLEALFDLKQSQTILPLYTLLRSAMEASFRLAYIAGDSGSFERHKRIFLASIEGAEKENAEWRKAKLIPDGKVQAVFEQFKW